jgi:hypothetical protein
MQPVKQYTAEQVDGPITLQVYSGANGAFTLYQDDGSTFNYRNGEWMGIEMSWNDRRHRLNLRLADKSRMLPWLSRKIEIHLQAEKTSRLIVFNGPPLEVQF